MSVKEVIKYEITCSGCNTSKRLFDNKYATWMCKSCKKDIQKPDYENTSDPRELVDEYYKYTTYVDKMYDLDYVKLQKIAEAYYIKDSEVAERIKPCLPKVWDYAWQQGHSGGYRDILYYFQEIVDIFTTQETTD